MRRCSRPGAGRTGHDGRSGTDIVSPSDKALVKWFQTKDGRPQTVAAIDEEFGLRRHRVKIDRGAEEQAIAVDQSTIQLSHIVVDETISRRGILATRLAGGYFEVVQHNQAVSHGILGVLRNSTGDPSQDEVSSHRCEPLAAKVEDESGFKDADRLHKAALFP